MFDNTVSMFRCVSIGIAAENKKLGSSTLSIVPHEKTPFLDGELVDRVDNLDYESQGNTGASVSGTAFVSNTIIAEWLPSTNRRTPPDIQRGEKVQLWQMASDDKYYWTSLGKDDKLRRLETVVLGISANPDPDADGTDLDNMYFIEISSHNRTITLSTSQMNNEFCTFDFQFDTGNGKVVLQDNLGDSVLFDARNTNIRFENKMGTLVELNRQDINISAPKDVNMKAAGNVDVRAKKITLNGGGSVLTLEGGGTTLKTPSFKGGS